MPLIAGVLPAGLTHLTFGNNYIKKLVSGFCVLPNNLTHLGFIGQFEMLDRNQPILKNPYLDIDCDDWSVNYFIYLLQLRPNLIIIGNLHYSKLRPNLINVS
jgi:hypothetical protein